MLAAGIYETINSVIWLQVSVVEIVVWWIVSEMLWERNEKYIQICLSYVTQLNL